MLRPREIVSNSVGGVCMFKVDMDGRPLSNNRGRISGNRIFCKRRTPLHFGSGVHGCRRREGLSVKGSFSRTA